jgi:ABC-type amino acid transport substrate-binding protein
MQLLHHGELRVGTHFVTPPFEFIDQGMRVGFEVDLMDAIARKLRLRPIFVDTCWEIILGEMQRNRFDCIIGGITITPGRQKILDWSTTYMVNDAEPDRRRPADAGSHQPHRS